MTTLRQATASDFKKGNLLITKIGNWEFRLRNYYGDGMWESGCSIVYECAAEHYLVKA